MALRDDGRLGDWIVEALTAHGGSADIVQICKHIWEHHEAELRQSGDGFYTWQYDMRWNGQKLRDEEILQPKKKGDRGPWRLMRHARRIINQAEAGND